MDTLKDDGSQSANGPGRPTCEVDPLLILAHGPKRFDPNQKRDGRVEIRSIPIDPRVDPTAPSSRDSAAPPPPSRVTTTALRRPSQGAAARPEGGPRRGRQGAARVGRSCHAEAATRAGSRSAASSALRSRGGCVQSPAVG